MLAYIQGEIIQSFKGVSVILLSNGLGFEVATQKEYPLGKAVKLHLETVYREDSRNIYGFEKYIEKKLFLSLLKVRGIGPKTAFRIVSEMTFDDLVFGIEKEDEKFLQEFPGIGKKAAKQLILDLKGSLWELQNLDEAKSEKNETLEAIDALESLGLERRKSVELLQKLSEKERLGGTELKIKNALKYYNQEQLSD